MKIQYIGMFDAVEVPAWRDPQTGYGRVAQRGEAVDIPDTIAEGLLDQPDNWAPAEPPARRGGKTEPTTAEE